MEELTRLIREDMKPALGVTEPGAKMCIRDSAWNESRHWKATRRS